MLPTIERLRDAINNHDATYVADCFTENYQCDTSLSVPGLRPFGGCVVRTIRSARRVIPPTPRLLCDDLMVLKQAAIAGLGIVALPGYVCCDDVRSGALR